MTFGDDDDDDGDGVGVGTTRMNTGSGGVGSGVGVGVIGSTTGVDEGVLVEFSGNVKLEGSVMLNCLAIK